LVAGKSRDELMAVYPRHKAFLEPFVGRGEVVGVGPFHRPRWRQHGPLPLPRRGLRRERPVLVEGLVKEYQIKDWGDQMLT